MIAQPSLFEAPAADTSGWNPRFALYARAHAMTPAAMLAHLRTHPTAGMTPFMIWSSQMWSEWKIERGYRLSEYPPVTLTTEMRADHYVWLTAKVEAPRG